MEGMLILSKLLTAVLVVSGKTTIAVTHSLTATYSVPVYYNCLYYHLYYYIE
jgi:hypothetical protein